MNNMCDKCGRGFGSVRSVLVDGVELCGACTRWPQCFECGKVWDFENVADEYFFGHDCEDLGGEL